MRHYQESLFGHLKIVNTFKIMPENLEIGRLQDLNRPHEWPHDCLHVVSGRFRTLAVFSIHSTFQNAIFWDKTGIFLSFYLVHVLLFLAPIPKWGHTVETVALVICCRHPLDQYGVARRSKRSESSLLFFHTYLFLFLIDPNRSFDMEAPDLFDVWIPVVLKSLLLIQIANQVSEGGRAVPFKRVLNVTQCREFIW